VRNRAFVQLSLLIFGFFLGITSAEAGSDPLAKRLSLQALRCAKSLTYLRGFVGSAIVHKRVLPKIYTGEEMLLRSQSQYLKSLPARDLSKYPAVKKFLKKNKVYLSLTTSPSRISKIHHVLESLDLENVEKVYLVIPKVFERNQSRYQLPAKVLSIPKLEIIEIEHDLGPITKLIPAAEHLAHENPNSLLITIDDDTGYPFGLINELIYWSSEMQGAVVGAAGRNLSKFEIHDSNFPRPNAIKQLHKAEAKSVEVIEGYGAIAYPVGRVNTELMRRWNDLCPECRVSDDLVISLALELSGVSRYHVWSPYMNLYHMIQYGYGFKEDALHKGAGLVRDANYVESFVNQNYQRAYRAILSDLLAPLP
jgi:hypothetical protein